MVKTGLDRLSETRFAPLHGQRLGVLLHPASVDGSLRHAASLLQAAPGIEVRAWFGPQHGIWGQTQDNMVEWEGFTDPQSRRPVHSLYGTHRKPTAAMLADIDTLLVDLQDVGARYYTFIWTLLLCLEACAEHGKKVVVLDRPNPLGGVQREGAVLDLEYSSFVGMAPIPMRHGLTIGELARYFTAWRGLDLELDVIWMEGWRRTMGWPDTGLPWVLPSPNMPTWETALVYPGGCLLEGTRLSEGRGTTRPFEIFGAPYVDPWALVRELEPLRLPGCRLRPLYFQPTFHKYAGEVCGGVQVHVTDWTAFASVPTYTAAVMAVVRLWPDAFAWREPPYEYEEVKLPIDILSGGPGWRTAVEQGRPLAELQSEWAASLQDFAAQVGEFLHYE